MLTTAIDQSIQLRRRAHELSEDETAVTPTKEEVDGLVSRMVESGLIKSGDRLYLLLQYLLGEELSGRGDRLKAYSIAIDVFGRGPDFNPAIDSTVRVEMLRLRRAMMACGLAAPAASLMVEFNKGSYRPRFYRVVGAPGPIPRRISGLVYALLGLGAVVGALALSTLLLRPNVEHCLTPTLTIQLNDPVVKEAAMLTAEVRSMAEAFQTVQVLDKALTCEGNLASHLSLRIYRQDTTEIVADLTSGGPSAASTWARTQVLPRDATTDAVLTALARIVFDVASEDGVLMVEALKRAWPSIVEKQNAACLRTAEAFLTGRDDSALGDVTTCLDQAISDRTDDSRIYGAYALTVQLPYLREMLALPPEVDARYQGLVKQALHLNPIDTRALTARLREHRRAIPPKLDELHRLTSIVDLHLSGHPWMLYQAAMVEGYYLGNWKQASAMIERARSIGGPNPSYQYVVVASYMMNNDWEAARERLTVRQEVVNPLEGVLMIAVGSHLYDGELIADGRNILAQTKRDDIMSIKDYINELNYEPAISQKLYDLCLSYYESQSGAEVEQTESPVSNDRHPTNQR